MSLTSAAARVAALAASLLLVNATHAAQAAADARLAPGSSSFDYTFVTAGAARKMTVWYHRPADAGLDAPIVFVLHGASRNASTYRKYWIPFADTQRFVLIVPEFSLEAFPSELEYNLGNMTAADGKPHAESEWSFNVVELLFDLVRTANGFGARQYDIYGHSAGGQFLHRLVLFKPTARYRVAVAANSGWYTMTDATVAFPYGLGSTSVGADQLARVFSRRLILLLGDADIDPQHRALKRTPEANAQGPHRYAQGHAFFERARQTAAELKTPFAWTLQIAPGVAHSNAGMAPYAARFVGGGELSR